MNRDEYRAHPALNFSLAKHLLKSAAHFKAAEDEEKQDTEEMAIGTLAHAMVLEGKDLRDLYAIKPAGMSFATKEGKAWKAEQTKPILSEDAAASIPQIADAITKNPMANGLIRMSKEREFPVLFNFREVDCKALLDGWGNGPEGPFIIDFKTTQDANPLAFAKQAARMDYDMQAAWYSTALGAHLGLEEDPVFLWVATEKKPPFVNMAMKPSAEFVSNGMRKMERAIEVYQECMKTGNWPLPYHGRLVQIQLPAWANQE